MSDLPSSTQETNGSGSSALVLLPLILQRRENNEDLVIGIIWLFCPPIQLGSELVVGLLTSVASNSQAYNELVIVYTCSILLSIVANLHLS